MGRKGASSQDTHLIPSGSHQASSVTKDTLSAWQVFALSITFDCCNLSKRFCCAVTTKAFVSLTDSLVMSLLPQQNDDVIHDCLDSYTLTETTMV